MDSFLDVRVAQLRSGLLTISRLTQTHPGLPPISKNVSISAILRITTVTLKSFSTVTVNEVFKKGKPLSSDYNFWRGHRDYPLSKEKTKPLLLVFGTQQRDDPLREWSTYQYNTIFREVRRLIRPLSYHGSPPCLIGRPGLIFPCLLLNGMVYCTILESGK